MHPKMGLLSLQQLRYELSHHQTRTLRGQARQVDMEMQQYHRLGGLLFKNLRSHGIRQGPSGATSAGGNLPRLNV